MKLKNSIWQDFKSYLKEKNKKHLKKSTTIDIFNDFVDEWLEVEANFKMVMDIINEIENEES